MTAALRPSAEIVAALDLAPHTEGGFYRETYRSPVQVMTSRGPRALSTSILYLVDDAHPSRFHRLVHDEMWYFHDGWPLEMIFLEDGAREPRRVMLDKERPQVLAPGGVWMAARVRSERDWTLAGCVVTPGFEYDDFERARPEALMRQFPAAAEVIAALG